MKRDSFEGVDYKDSDGNSLFPGWYWVTSLSEGDVWYPINIQEVYWIMDGNIDYDFSKLSDLTIKRAVLPGEIK